MQSPHEYSIGDEEDELKDTDDEEESAGPEAGYYHTSSEDEDLSFVGDAPSLTDRDE